MYVEICANVSDIFKNIFIKKVNVKIQIISNGTQYNVMMKLMPTLTQDV